MYDSEVAMVRCGGGGAAGSSRVEGGECVSLSVRSLIM